MRKFSSIKPLDPRLLVQLLILSCVVAGALLPDLAYAGTDDAALQPAWTTVSGFLTGAGGRIITGVAFLGAVIGSVWGFNPRMVIGAAGIGVTTALAPAFITATVGCLI